MHRHKIFTHCMLFNYQAITRKRSLNWDLGSTRHHPTSTFQTHIKKQIFFFQNTVSLSRQSCRARAPVARAQTANSAYTCRVAPHGRACHTPCAHVTGVLCTLCVRLACLPGWLLTQKPSCDQPVQGPEISVFCTVLDHPLGPEHFLLPSQNFRTEHQGHSWPRGNKTMPLDGF